MLNALGSIYIGIISTYIIGATISLVLCKRHPLANALSNAIAIVASLSGIVFALCKFLYYTHNTVRFSLSTSISLFSVDFYIDNLSAFFVLMISSLSLIVSIYSISYMKHYFYVRNIGYFGFLYNLFIASMLMVVTSGQLFFFLVVWEIMSLVSYFLVTYENEKHESYKAGKIYIIMTHIGTMFIMAAFVLIYVYTRTAKFDLINIATLPAAVKNVTFIFLLIGFGTKAGVIPLHIWLPYAHPAAPSNVSALMSGIMIKTAIYGIIRFVIVILGAPTEWWGGVILIAGASSTILGVAYALMENNIKRLLAYSSIENIGIILIGIGIAAISKANGQNLIAAFALSAAMLHALNHSVFKGLLFMGAGSIHYSTGTKDMEKLGGLIKKMPYTAVFFLAGALSISAIPPLNGFIGEWITYQSLFLSLAHTGNLVKILTILTVALLAMAGALAAYCFVKLFGIAFLAMPRTTHASEAKEVPKTMRTAMGISAMFCLLIGIFPWMIIKMIDLVNVELLKTSVCSGITGFSSVLLFPLSVKNVSLSPVVIGVSIISICIILVLVNALVGKKSKVRIYGTWDCGYVQLNSRMQYTATGFSKPIRIVLRAIFRPQRELQVEEGSSPYFYKNAKYVVSTQSIIEKYFYKPMIKKLFNFARRMRLIIQTGSVHTYLIYIFIVIIAMFIYYARS